jgi:hypothetical protein
MTNRRRASLSRARLSCDLSRWFCGRLAAGRRLILLRRRPSGKALMQMGPVRILILARQMAPLGSPDQRRPRDRCSVSIWLIGAHPSGRAPGRRGARRPERDGSLCVGGARPQPVRCDDLQACRAVRSSAGRWVGSAGRAQAKQKRNARPKSPRARLACLERRDEWAPLFHFLPRQRQRAKPGVEQECPRRPPPSRTARISSMPHVRRPGSTRAPTPKWPEKPPAWRL